MLLLLLATGPYAASAQDADVLELARQAAESGDYQNAIDFLTLRLQEDPDDWQARYFYARVLGWSGDWLAAAAEYDDLLVADPGNVDFLLGQAQVRVWSGKPARALPMLEVARYLAPGYETVWALEIQALREIGTDTTLRLGEDLSDLARQRFPDAGWHAEGSLPSIAPRSNREGQFRVATWISYESLDSGLPDWQSVVLEGDYRRLDKEAWYGHLRRTDRFNQTDNELMVGTYVPINPRWLAVAEATVAPDAEVLPRWSAMARLEVLLGGGWELGGSLRHSDYQSTFVDVQTVEIVRYSKSYRFAYSLHRGEPDNADTTLSHVLRLDRYYGEDNRLTVLYASGEESENVGLSQLLISDIETLSLQGQHQVSRRWAFLWALSYHEQGDFYTRNGIHVGLRRNF